MSTAHPRHTRTREHLTMVAPRTSDPAMVREMRAPWLWTNATVILLGPWLDQRAIRDNRHNGGCAME